MVESYSAAAVVEEGAKIGANVIVRRLPDIHLLMVEIGEGTEIMSHVVIKGHTVIGKDNRIFPQAVIGEENQIRNMVVRLLRLLLVIVMSSAKVSKSIVEPPKIKQKQS